MNPILELAQKIFLKKLPNEHVTDRTGANVRSVAEQSLRASELFFQTAKLSGHMDITLTAYLEDLE